MPFPNDASTPHGLNLKLGITSDWLEFYALITVITFLYDGSNMVDGLYV